MWKYIISSCITCGYSTVETHTVFRDNTLYVITTLSCSKAFNQYAEEYPMPLYSWLGTTIPAPITQFAYENCPHNRSNV